MTIWQWGLIVEIGKKSDVVPPTAGWIGLLKREEFLATTVGQKKKGARFFARDQFFLIDPLALAPLSLDKTL